MSNLEDTTGDAIQYGVYFLREAGFFRKRERFWTDQDFPQAKTVHAQLKARLEKMGHSETELGRAYKKLGDTVD